MGFNEFTRNDDDLLLSTEDHVVKKGNNVIGIAITRIAGKWCKQGAELEHLLATSEKDLRI